MNRNFTKVVRFVSLLLILVTSCGTVETPTTTPPSSPTVITSPTPVQSPTATESLGLTGTLTLWHSWNEQKTRALVDIIELFREQHPEVLFDVLYVPFDDLRTRFENAAEFGSAPNIFIGPSEWGYSLYEDELILEVTNNFDEELFGTINPPALSSMQYREILIGIPFAQNGILMYRNKNLIPEAPENINDLESAAKSATASGNIGADLERGFLFSAAHLVGMGGRWVDEGGNPVFNHEIGIAWLELLQSFDQIGETEFNTNEDVNLFQEGRVGIILEGSWLMTAISDTVGIKSVAVDPWPRVNDGRLSGFIHTESLYISALTDEQERGLASAFINFFMIPENQATLAASGFIPTVIDTEVDDPLIRQAMDAFAGGTGYPLDPEFEYYRDPMEGVLLAVFNKTLEAEPALQMAQDEIMKTLIAVREGSE